MSEPVARQRPMIDLDEFERRLRRPAAAPQRNDDPLAELARLVGGGQDPFHGVFQEKPSQAKASQEKLFPERPVPLDRGAAADSLARSPAKLAGAEKAIRAERSLELPRLQDSVEARQARAPTRDPLHDRGLHAARSQGLGGDFAAIEAGLRGSTQPEFGSAPVQHAAQHYAQDYQEPVGEEDDEDWLDEAQMAMTKPAEMPEPPRSRALLYVTAAIILVGIGGIGATFAIKRTPVSPQQIAMIKAATGPAKVQAPAPAASDGGKAIQDASLLDKTPQPAPVGVINRVEQPMDLPQAAADAGNGSAAQGAASVPVPAPPSGTAASPGETAPSGPTAAAQPWEGPGNGPQVADAAAGEALGLGGIIQPKKVRTVTVRPDGTIVADDSQPPIPPVSPLGAQGTPPQPDGADAAKDETPKTTATVDTGAEPAETEALVASRTGSEQAPEDGVKPKVPARAKPIKVVDLDNGGNDAAAEHSHAGDFAVQLAAPTTEAEARHTLSRLAQRFAGELGDHRLKFHRVKVGSKSVYRVRAGGFTKAAAATLCQAVEAKGATCFVARD